MKLTQLLYFQTVCHYNSVTKAANVLNVAQPSISASIRNLEDEFGVNLFRRVKQRLVLTNEGAFLLKYADQLLEMAEGIEEKMVELGQKRRHIRVAVPPMAGTFAFNDLFFDFKQNFPKAEVEVLESPSSKNLISVADESVDIAIATSRVIVNDHLNVLPLKKMRICFAVHPEHRLAGETIVDYSMLQDEPLILFRPGSRHNAIIVKGFDNAGIKPNILLYSSQIYTIREFILKGHASAFVFDSIADLFKDLVKIPVKGVPEQTVDLVWKKEEFLINRRRYLFDDVERFIAFARDSSTGEASL